MILAAGLTPAWQQIVSLPALLRGEVNRAADVHWCASGKVLNVGLAAQQLGGAVRVLAPVGGPHGTAIQQACAATKLATEWILTGTPTRVCTTVIENAGTPPLVTELVENAASMESTTLAAFASAYARAVADADTVVLSGSLPTGTPRDFYRDLLRVTGSRAILDVRGEELHLALAERPFLVKPNIEELSQTVGRELPTEADVFSAIDELHAAGAQQVVITQGSGPVLASDGTRRFRALPPRVDVKNPIGCGDSFAAGLAVAASDNADFPEALRSGIAAASANAEQLLPVVFDSKRVQELAALVSILPA